MDGIASVCDTRRSSAYQYQLISYDTHSQVLPTGLRGVSSRIVLPDSIQLTDDFSSQPLVWILQRDLPRASAGASDVHWKDIEYPFTSDHSTLRPQLPSSPPTPLVRPHLSQE